MERLRDNPPASVLGLRRRLRSDERRIQDVLRSNGFYAGRLTTSVSPPEDGLRTVLISLAAGPQYVFHTPEIAFDTVDTPLLDLADLVAGLEGKPAVAADAIALESGLIDRFTAQGYPFVRPLTRRAEVDHARQRILLTYAIEPGPYAVFGAPVFSGLNTVKSGYLERLVPWQTGAEFDRTQLSAYRRALIDTRLFTSVKVDAADTEDLQAGDALEIDVSLTEGAHRTIGAVGRYARDEGFGGGVSWQHRNFFGQGETLDLEADGSELRQLVAAQVTKPAFRRLDQVLDASVELLHEDNDAFEEYSVLLTTGLERDLWSVWRGRLGVSLEAAELTDPNGTDQSYLAGLPLRLSRDASDDLLDPKRGYRMVAEVTPYAGQFAGTALFATVALSGSYYHPLSDSPRPIVAAVRAKAGSIFGESAEDVPANKRFYSGGGGSVRGFGYRLIGALNDAGTPLGGRSLLEAAVEARVPVTDTIAVVPFVDSGLVSSDVVPKFTESLRVGAGLGIRYQTPVGPFRFDLAIPVNRRRGVDNSFQFYISFGQAF